MEESIYTIIEELIRILIESGLLGELGDTASDAITQILTDTSQGIIQLIVDLIVELAKESMIFLIGLIVAIASVVLSAIATVVLYLIETIALLRLSKIFEVKHRWMAWIPYARTYLFGMCAEASAVRNGKKPWKWGIIMLMMNLAFSTIGRRVLQIFISVILSVIPGLSTIISLLLELAVPVLFIMNTYCLYLIYRSFMEKPGAVVLSIVSLFMYVFEGVILLVVSFRRLCAAEKEPVVAAEPWTPTAVSAGENQDSAFDDFDPFADE